MNYAYYTFNKYVKGKKYVFQALNKSKRHVTLSALSHPSLCIVCDYVMYKPAKRSFYFINLCLQYEKSPEQRE